MSPGYPNAVSAPLLLKTSQQLQLRESSINLGWDSYVSISIIWVFKVDLLPKSLRNVLFQTAGSKQSQDKRQLQSALQVLPENFMLTVLTSHFSCQELRKFGLTPEEGQKFDLPDVSSYLPMPKGGSVSRHLRSEASRQSQPYVSLLCGLLAATPAYRLLDATPQCCMADTMFGTDNHELVP